MLSLSSETYSRKEAFDKYILFSLFLLQICSFIALIYLFLVGKNIPGDGFVL